MNTHEGRVCQLAGTAYEVGFAMGQHLGPRLDNNITRYIQERAPHLSSDSAWREDARVWLSTLPPRFQEEFEGLAAGTGLPLDRVAEWPYVEVSLNSGCSSALVTLDGQVWVARNNDLDAPELWGYASIKEVRGRIPTITFGMEGDVFAGTGVNRQRLWLHYHYLPAASAPPKETLLPCYVWLVEALETCSTLAEVETLLARVPRDGAMLLFAVDGKNNTRALYECGYATHQIVDSAQPWLIGTNHSFVSASDGEGTPQSSMRRCARLKARLPALVPEARQSGVTPVMALRRLLADDGIEARGNDSLTVYANVACPATGELWYTFGGHPAASAGRWERLDWPWQDETRT